VKISQGQTTKSFQGEADTDCESVIRGKVSAVAIHWRQNRGVVNCGNASRIPWFYALARAAVFAGGATPEVIRRTQELEKEYGTEEHTDRALGAHHGPLDVVPVCDDAPPPRT